MTMRFLSWTEFRQAIHKIGEFAIENNVREVAGVPRGGLVVAVALSHEIGVPMVHAAATRGLRMSEGGLLVDDIADSGATLRMYRNYKLTAVWFKRWSCPSRTWAVEIERTDAWLVFPWENHAKAKADHDAYKARMSGASAE